MPRAFCTRAPSAAWRARRRCLRACRATRSRDHFRSRLTHTLEVTQIARTAGRRAGTERGAGRSAGAGARHRPSALWPRRRKGSRPRAARHGLSFDHNLHALRIVTWFEERYPAFRGLNLTLGVREGIVKHSRDYSAAEHPELSEYFLDEFPPLEAQLIDLADEIAYLTADLDDGLDSGILALEQVREAVPAVSRFSRRGAVASSPRRRRRSSL